MSAFFKVHNFSCGYSDKFVLRDVNLEAAKGRISGIIGPNGSGKTTLFRGITGELPPRTGEVWLNGRNIRDMSHNDRARSVAVVAQHVLASDVTVEDYVLMGRLPHRKKFQLFETNEDYDIAHHYMHLTNVYGLRDKWMSKISGGEQQLASIARALTQQPELLLLDEPTSHLDITHQVQIMNLIQKLNEEMQLSVLMIIHDLNLAGEYCDYLMMLKDGRPFKQGLPDTVLNYKVIEDGYKTVVVVHPNPVSQKPAVFPVSDKILKQQKRESGQK